MIPGYDGEGIYIVGHANPIILPRKWGHRWDMKTHGQCDTCFHTKEELTPISVRGIVNESLLVSPRLAV